MAEVEGRPYLAPGMTQIVYDDETLVLQDDDGNEFSVEGRPSERTLAFCKAFDEWFMAKENPETANQRVIIDALWHTVKTTYGNLPLRIQNQLTSTRGGAVVLKGHQH